MSSKSSKRDSSDKKRKASKKKDKTKKQKKHKKDPLAPKRPCTAYIFFSNARREEVKTQNPGIKFSEVAGKISELWKNISPKEKAKFEQMAKEAKEKYDEVKKEYDSSKHEHSSKKSSKKSSSKKSKHVEEDDDDDDDDDDDEDNEGNNYDDDDDDWSSEPWDNCVSNVQFVFYRPLFFIPFQFKFMFSFTTTKQWYDCCIRYYMSCYIGCSLMNCIWLWIDSKEII